MSRSDHRNPRLRRGFNLIALAALLGLMAAGLTQCRLVGDTVTGLDLKQNASLNARSRCIRDCNDVFKRDRQAEDGRHHDAIRACGSDPDCRKSENQLHTQNIHDLEAARQACKRGCYNEGAGNAGE